MSEYNYDPLWRLIESKGDTKTEMRRRLGLSTATLAKLSAGEAVAMDVLSKIASLYNCSFDDIVSLKKEKVSLRWNSLGKNSRMFSIQLVYFVTDFSAHYVLGYAVMYKTPDEGMNEWRLSKYDGFAGYYRIEGCADSECVKRLLESIEKKTTIETFCENEGITIRAGKGTKGIIEGIKKCMICNGSTKYHHPFIMPSRESARRFKSDLMPKVSPMSEAVVCEGFIGLAKRELYCKDGRIDKNRQDELLRLIRQEFSSVYNLELLGNFEVMTTISGVYDDDCGVDIHVEKVSDGHGDWDQTIVITFDHNKIGYHIRAELITYVGHNIVDDLINDFDSFGKNNKWTYSASQKVSMFEVKVWDSDRLSNRFGELLYQTCHYLIMGITLGVNITENTYNLIDEWDSKVAKSKYRKELKPEQVTKLNSLSIGKKDDVDGVLNRDFKTIIKKHLYKGEGAFFNKGEENQIEFLHWLKTIVNADDVEKVVLIDPYISIKAITAVLRCAKDYNQKWEIYLDTDKAKGRDDEIRNNGNSLIMAAPSDFIIYGVSGKLHDRYVILLGKGMERVFLLSNSLDTSALNYASTVLPADDVIASEIICYYIDLFSDEKKDVVFQSANHAAHHDEVIDHEKKFFVGFPEDYILEDDIGSSDNAEHIIAEFVRIGIVNLRPYELRECIGIEELLSVKGDMDYDLLHNAQIFCEHSVNYQRYTWKCEILYKAVKFLYDNDKGRFIRVIEQTFPTENDERNLTAAFVGLLMLHEITWYGFDWKNENKDVSTLLQCIVPFLRAIAVASISILCRIEDREDIFSILKRNLSEGDYVHSCVYILKTRLVANYVSSKVVSETEFFSEHDWMISQIVVGLHTLLEKDDNIDVYEYLTNLLDILYERGSDEIARIISGLVDAKTITREMGETVLIYYLLKKYNDVDCNDSGYIYAADLEESCQMINSIFSINQHSGVSIRKKLKNMEIKMDDRLYNPFLRDQNYKLWKKTVDILGSMVYLELFMEKEYAEKRNEKAIMEYLTISENFDTKLNKYSEVYRMVKEMWSSMGT